MLTPDNDTYYSPQVVTDALAACLRRRPRVVLDSNCGGGALLATVEREHPKVECAGIDADRAAIDTLRQSKPHWTLVRGDSLRPQTWNRMSDLLSRVDLTVLNPPFSMGQAKGLQLDVLGVKLRCSLAMAHVLRTVEQCDPYTILAVLPESLLASDLDSYGRALLEKKYNVSVVSSFRNSTFRGTRAHSALVSLTRTMEGGNARPATLSLGTKVLPKIVRGGLPVFEATYVKEGLPFVHTTNCSALPQSLTSLHRVKTINRGIVARIMLLLPRVGLPSKLNIRIVDLPRVQLSDCMIAMCFDELEQAEKWRELILNNWESFTRCYAGTGARYITLARLKSWMASL
jgi:predicted RNA methylase